MRHRAAEMAHNSPTDFILDSPYQTAAQPLLDQRLCMVAGSQYRSLMIADRAGIRAMLAHPIDDAAAQLSTRFGLVSSPVRERQLLSILKDARRLVA